MAVIFHTDIETTGLNPFHHAIHRISGIVEVNGDIASRFDFKVRPFLNAKIDENALRVCGVTYNEIRAYDAPDVVFHRFLEAVRPFASLDNKAFISAYNAGAMEVSFIRSWFEQCGYKKMFGEYFHSAPLDTMSIACSHLLNKGIVLANYSLQSVARRFDIEVDTSRLHDPVYDAELSRMIFKAATA